MNGVRKMNDGVQCPTGSSASGAGRVVAMALEPDVSPIAAWLTLLSVLQIESQCVS